MIQELSDSNFLRELVTKTKLYGETKTGDKKDVNAFFALFQGKLQVQFKYGHKFYVFNVDELDSMNPEHFKKIQYNEVHNLR